MLTFGDPDQIANILVTADTKALFRSGKHLYIAIAVWIMAGNTATIHGTVLDLGSLGEMSDRRMTLATKIGTLDRQQFFEFRGMS